MRFNQVQIDGFGIWSGLQLVDLSSDCTVFYGPNEAGKTTLLQFLRAALYGFTPERVKRYLPPLRGSEVGGSIVVESHRGKLIIQRRASDLQPLGEIAISEDSGKISGQTRLLELLHDVDEKTFANIFAVGLRELQELATLEESDAAKWLYSLTGGLDRVSLYDVLHELNVSRARILAEDSHASQIGQLLEDKKRLLRELDELTAQTHQYDQWAAYRADCDRDLARGQQSLGSLETDHKTVEAATVVFDTWQRRIQLEAQIAALDSNDRWPEKALLRMDRLSNAITKSRRAIRQLRADRGKIADDLQSSPQNQSLLQQSAKIAALAENEAWIVSVEQELAAAETQLKSLAAEQQDHNRRLTTDGKMTLPLTGKLDERLWQSLRGPAALLAKRRRKLKQLQRKSDRQRALFENRRREIETAMTPLGHRDLNNAVETAGQSVSQLRRRIQLDDQLKELEQTQQELEHRVDGIRERQILSPQIVTGVGIGFAFGVMLTLAGLFLPSSFTGSLGWPMVVLGAGYCCQCGSEVRHPAINCDATYGKRAAAGASSVASGTC